MNIFKTMLAVAAISLLAAPAMAQPVGFLGYGGLLIVDGAGTFTATFAEGGQSGGGQSFGKTESFANAAANFGVGTQLGFNANLAGSTGSASQSGSLVNGNGSAWNSTGGIAFSAAGIGAIAGVGFSN